MDIKEVPARLQKEVSPKSIKQMRADLHALVHEMKNKRAVEETKPSVELTKPAVQPIFIARFTSGS